MKSIYLVAQDLMLIALMICTFLIQNNLNGFNVTTFPILTINQKPELGIQRL
jgi:hypothetical protein